MTNLIKELYERKRKEELMKTRLQLYIGSIARLEIEYLCETKGTIKEELSSYIKQFYNCLKNLEKELGIPNKIIYTKFIDKRQVLISEYKSMQKELLYYIKKGEIIEKKLELLL